MTIGKSGNRIAIKHCHGKNKGKVIKSFPNTPEGRGKANRMHRAIQRNKKGRK